MNKRQIYIATLTLNNLHYIDNKLRASQCFEKILYQVFDETFPTLKDLLEYCYSQNQAYSTNLTISAYSNDTFTPSFEIKFTDYAKNYIVYDSTNLALEGLSTCINNDLSDETPWFIKKCIQYKFWLHSVCSLVTILIIIKLLLPMLNKLIESLGTLIAGILWVFIIYIVSIKIPIKITDLTNCKVWFNEKKRNWFHLIFSPTQANIASVLKMVLSFALGYCLNYIISFLHN